MEQVADRFLDNNKKPVGGEESAKQIAEVALAQETIQEFIQHITDKIGSQLEENQGDVSRFQQNIERFYSKKTESGEVIFDKEKASNFPFEEVMHNSQLSNTERGAMASYEMKNRFGIELSDNQVTGIITVHNMFSPKGAFELTPYEGGLKVKKLIDEYGFTQEQAQYLCDSGLCGGVERFISNVLPSILHATFFVTAAATFDRIDPETKNMIYAGYFALWKVLGLAGTDEMVNSDAKVTISHINWTALSSLTGVLGSLASFIAKSERFDDLPGAEALSEIDWYTLGAIIAICIYSYYKKQAGGLESTEGRSFPKS